MRRLLPTKEQRQIKIIEFFIEHDQYANIDELQKKFNINPRTLINDLEEITERVPFFSVEQVKKNILLKSHQNCGLNEAYKEYLQQDLAFSILDELFHTDSLYINELAKILYTSETSVYRSIKNINTTLDEAGFGFQIQLTPCMLVGKEEEIRRFFVNYYYEATSISEWNFETIPQTSFNEALEVLLSHYEFTSTFALFFKMSLIIAVNIIRTQNGHFLSPENIDLDHCVPNDSPDINAAIKTMAKIAGVENLSPNSLYNLFFPCLDSRIIYNYANFVQKAFTNPFFNQSFLWLNNIIDTLKGKLSFKVKKHENLIVNLHNIAVIGSHMPGAYPILSKPVIHYMDIVNDWSPDIYDMSHKLIEDYLSSVFNIHDTITIDYVHFYLMTYWTDYTEVFTNNTRNIKILIITQYHASHLEFLKNWFNCNLSQQVQIDTYQDFTLNISELANSDWDIIVADFSIRGLENKLFLKIPIIPQQKDFNALSYRISIIRHNIANNSLKNYQSNAIVFDYMI